MAGNPGSFGGPGAGPGDAPAGAPGGPDIGGGWDAPDFGYAVDTSRVDRGDMTIAEAMAASNKAYGTTSTINALASVIPVVGPLNAMAGLFGLPSIGSIAQGTPDPNFGRGNLGPEGGVGVGGGIGDPYKQAVVANYLNMAGQPYVDPMASFKYGAINPFFGNAQPQTSNFLPMTNFYGTQAPFQFSNFFGGK